MTEVLFDTKEKKFRKHINPRGLEDRTLTHANIGYKCWLLWLIGTLGAREGSPSSSRMSLGKRNSPRPSCSLEALSVWNWMVLGGARRAILMVPGS